jgi:E2F/DP family winged-helix DNA-binding domain
MTSPQPTHSIGGRRSSTAAGLMFSPNSSAAAMALSALSSSSAAVPTAAAANPSMTTGILTEGGGGGQGGDSLHATRLFGHPLYASKPKESGLVVVTQSQSSEDGDGHSLHPPSVTPSFSSSTTSSNDAGTAAAATSVAQRPQQPRSVVGVTWAPTAVGRPESIHPGQAVSTRLCCLLCSIAYSSRFLGTQSSTDGIKLTFSIVLTIHLRLFACHYQAFLSAPSSSTAAPNGVFLQVDPYMPVMDGAMSLVTPTPKKFKMEDGTAVAITHPPVAAGGGGGGDGQADTSSYETHNLLTTAYSRKTKSLGILSDNFLAAFKDYAPGAHIIVDEAAILLGVERRRIYDIVNILESIGVVCKEKKNTYAWMGVERLPRVFGKLQEKAITEHPEDAQKYLGHMPPPQTNDALDAPLTDRETCKNASSKSKSSTKTGLKGKDTRSLAKLAQEFLQVYLVGNETLSLPEASDKIQGSATLQELIALGGGPSDRTVADTVDLDEQRELRAAASRGLKTKIRRLYDIANVFLSVGLLAKVENKKGELSRRPHFTWTYHMSPYEIYQLHNNMFVGGPETSSTTPAGVVLAASESSLDKLGQM